MSVCAYCGRSDLPMHLDHVVPRSRGGPDDPRNLVTACEKCNLAKSDKLPSEWLERVPPLVAEIELRVCARVVAGIRSSRGPRPAPLLTCDVCGKDIARAGNDAWVAWFCEDEGHYVERKKVLALAVTCHGGLDGCASIARHRNRRLDPYDHHLSTFCGDNASLRFAGLLLDYTWPDELLLRLIKFFFVASQLPGCPMNRWTT